MANVRQTYVQLRGIDTSNQWKYVTMMWFDVELHHKTYNYVILVA